MLIAMASLALFTAAYSNNAAMGEETDNFGIQEIYPTKDGGQEWYVDMADPRSDSQFKNLDNVRFSSDGNSWHVSADQVRMEAWSQANEKWLNVEITAYAKIDSGSTELLQLYSRGGHHTDSDQCEGSAYKARLYGDGTAAWTKEITHPAYAENRGEMQATDTPLVNRWVGFKAVTYNFVDEDDGSTYVRLESYIDDDVTDSDGNLAVANNWKLASVVEDRGGWATDNSDFNSSCGRARDEILTSPGGTDSQNIVGFRTDDIGWDFEYLSVREIDPLAEEIAEEPDKPASPEPAAPPVVAPPEVPPVEPVADGLPPGYLIANSSRIVEEDGTARISGIDTYMRKVTTRTSGDVSIAVMQNGRILALGQVEASDLEMDMQPISVPIGPATVSGSYQVLVFFYGSGYVAVGDIQTVIG